MADSHTYPIMSVCATVGSRVQDLPITDGQLVFIRDKHKLALDYDGKRVFYNQIDELDTDEERVALLAPITGHYYFVIKTAVLWTYQDGWVQITTPPNEIVFIGTQLPELGSANTLYVDKANKEISVWDSETSSYMVVSEKTKEMTAEEIDALFAD